jgi:predicted metal-dependent peptidase
MGGDLPGKPHLPENFDLPDGWSCEEYFFAIKKQEEEEPKGPPPPGGQPGGGSGGDGDDDQQDQGQPGDEGNAQPDQDGDEEQDQAQPQKWGRQPGEFCKPGELADRLGIQHGQPKQIETKWKIAIAQAAMLAEKARGEWPGGLKQWIEARLNPKVRWQNEMQDWVMDRARDDYSWSRPNRRFIELGIYLPTCDSDVLPKIGVMIDTSGSIDEKEQSQFLAEVRAIGELHPSELVIFFHHTDCYHTDHWKPGDNEYCMPEIETGGTSHVPVFDAALKEEGIKGIIALTDCYTDYPDYRPNVPVIWAVMHNDDPKPPFGRVVMIKDFD